jgi:hypothetical protein
MTHRSNLLPPRPSAARRTSRWRRTLGIAGLAAGIVGLGAMSGMAPPEPDPIPRRWQLEVELGPLRLVTFDVKDQGPRAYFYTTYTVANTSGEDLLFAPSFELAMDNQVVRSGRNVPLEVTKQLLKNSDIPQIEDQISIIGQILQGRENAKKGLVVWTANELAPVELTVYAAGFSGETATVERPDTKAKVVLRKTLMARYAPPGDLTQNGKADLPLAEPIRWIMR